MYELRPFHFSDLPRLYHICLATGDQGGDATGQVDAEILGHFFAAPYALFEPDLCTILTRHGEPVGYILGTKDSAGFENRCNQQWWPFLRQRYPIPQAIDDTRQANMVRSIHKGYEAPTIHRDYPAHLHIDLLPVAQGQGQGKVMMMSFLDQLQASSVVGVHLGVSRHNQRALSFYPKFGFREIDLGDKEAEGSVTFVLNLNA